MYIVFLQYKPDQRKYVSLRSSDYMQQYTIPLLSLPLIINPFYSKRDNKTMAVLPKGLINN